MSCHCKQGTHHLRPCSGTSPSGGLRPCSGIPSGFRSRADKVTSVASGIGLEGGRRHFVAETQPRSRGLSAPAESGVSMRACFRTWYLPHSPRSDPGCGLKGATPAGGLGVQPNAVCSAPGVGGAPHALWSSQPCLPLIWAALFLSTGAQVREEEAEAGHKSRA